jgi:hypothetical protein
VQRCRRFDVVVRHEQRELTVEVLPDDVVVIMHG